MTAHRILQDLYYSPLSIPDPGDAGTIRVSKNGAICNLTLAGSETRTLAQPTRAGIEVIINVANDSAGTCTLTVTGGYNQADTTTLVLADVEDWVKFVSIKNGTSFYWRVVAQEGTTATQTDATLTSATITTATINKMAFSTFTAVAAANSAINNAAPLSYGFNVVSAADNTKAVILPVATAGMVVWVASPTANVSLPVFPQVNSAIGGAAANAVCTLAAGICGAGGIFVADNATHWCVFGEIA